MWVFLLCCVGVLGFLVLWLGFFIGVCLCDGCCLFWLLVFCCGFLVFWVVVCLFGFWVFCGCVGLVFGFLCFVGWLFECVYAVECELGLVIIVRIDYVFSGGVVGGVLCLVVLCEYGQSGEVFLLCWWVISIWDFDIVLGVVYSCGFWCVVYGAFV